MKSTSAAIKVILYILSISMFTSFFSCKKEKVHATVSGTIQNADSSLLLLERRTLSQIVFIDSVRLDAEGKFEFKPDTLSHSELYTLRLNTHVINFIIDSTETININSDKKAFSTKYEIEGTPKNKDIKTATLAYYKLFTELASLDAKLKTKDIKEEEFSKKALEVVGSYKENTLKLIASNFDNLAAYFILFQKIGDMFIYDPSSKEDLPYFRATATAMDMKEPNSPRSKHLKEYVLTIIASQKQQEKNNAGLLKMLEDGNNDTGLKDLYNISLPDIAGKTRELAQLKGKVVILSFTSYASDFSAEYNVLLNDLYKRFGDKLEIYQVAFDKDLHLWRNTANNLPWICVRDKDGLNSDLFNRFNTKNLPTTFLFGKDGIIAKRIEAKDNIYNELTNLVKK